MMSTATFEDTEATPLTRELSVLSSLSQFGWLTTQQLHALCFQGMAVSTVRTTLHYFEEANWVHHVRWRIGAPDGGHIWAIQLKGIRTLQQYLPAVPRIVCDLSRPTCALEQEEWRVQLAIRNFMTRFVLETRQRPLVAVASVALPTTTWQHALATPRIQPDFSLSLAWDPAVVQSSIWLPWTDPASADAESVRALPARFALYCDRTARASHLAWLIRTVTAETTGELQLPIVVLRSEDRRAAAQEALCQIDPQPVCHVVTWAELEYGLLARRWRDHDQPAMCQSAS